MTISDPSCFWYDNQQISGTEFREGRNSIKSSSLWTRTTILHTAFSRAQKRDCIKIHIADTPNVQGEFKNNTEKRILEGTYTDKVVFKNILLSRPGL